MIIRPLHDRVLVNRLAAQDKTTGGLFIPDAAKEKPLEALVIALGNGKVLENGRTTSFWEKSWGAQTTTTECTMPWAGWEYRANHE